MSASYVYQPLEIDAPYIRLMTVLPDEAGRPIRITLRHANLAEVPRPAYQTVSYVWGDPTRSACLKVSGHGNRSRYRCLYVPANTAAVLNRIRLTDRKRTIWQDAVCINQDDLVERGYQVSLMSKLCSSSTGNIVYLGELSDPTMEDRISTAMTILLSNAEENTCGFSTFRTTTIDEATSERRFDVREREPLVDQEAVAFMLELPWFRRLWTLQEAALAPANTAILGTLRWNLVDVLRALIWWDCGQPPPPSSPEAQAGLTCVIQTHGYIDHEQGFVAWCSVGIGDLLHCSMMLEKTEPRDGVYATLGLLEKALSQLLTPDYTKPLSEILQTATRLAMMERGNLDLLRWIKIRPGDLEGAHIASWVLRVDRQLDLAVDPLELSKVFAAAERLEYDLSLYRVSLDCASIMARGYTVGEVGMLSSVCSQADREYYETWLVWIKDAFGLYIVQTAPHAPLQTCRAFGRTLLGGGFLAVASKAQAVTDEELRPLDEFTYLLWKATWNRDLEKDATWQYYLDVALEALADTFQTWPSTNRRFFVSTSGQYGLGPGAMQSGDIVTLLCSVRTPMILRPLPTGQYQLVGEAYVDGIMFGEAWKEFKTTGAVEEEFLLV
ncbi:hypothetical protein LTR27_012999 [Elasticomyces elasticus]|nr:hypothetical protein LTR27_012999 [Elasticomyces elasticus]